MLDSIHPVRWLSRFENKRLDFLMFPSSLHRKVHSDFEKLPSGSGTATFQLVPLACYFSLPFWVLDKCANSFFRRSLSKAAIKNFQPDVVRYLELQNTGYLILRSLDKVKPAYVKLVARNRGSDIFCSSGSQGTRRSYKDFCNLLMFISQSARGMLYLQGA